MKPGLVKKSWKRECRTCCPFIPLSLQKGFAGGKVSLRDCFNLFTKEEELESENAPVCGVQTGCDNIGGWGGGCSIWDTGVA